MSRTDEYIARGKHRIPGLTQLLSKRPDQFAPGVWPTYFSKASGTRVWDLDGREYLDMSISGIGANILGYCDPDVDAAVIKCVQSGNSSSLNAPEDVELAELLCNLHPWADKVRFARTGGEALTVAVRIARAATGRDRVAFCGYHGWHDWYLAANLSDNESLTEHLLPGLSPLGVPKGLRGTALPFRYNQINELKAIFAQHPDEVAAVVMEPLRNEMPEPGFLEEVKALAKAAGAVLVFDEVSVGFRLNTGGYHRLVNIEPDVAVFAKAMSNGYPMAAIIGVAGVMDAVERTFISSTYWTDRIGPVAALATIRKHEREQVSDHLHRIGKAVQDVWTRAATQTGLDIHVYGIYPMSHFGFDAPDAQARMTFYVQEMLKRGFLASNRFYANYAQRPEHVQKFGQATAEVFGQLAGLVDQGPLAPHLTGGVSRPGFHRLN
ncbi:MAG: aminotransferase class III [Betaproteobacteria bacterium HGW-Betaproteobacteria-3]|jgi:glutamate-1-semialdehyde 2,1-aminomutase|nr:MAG: aminotransferase class III [Betaproteobacteria bacterium HGW-Betaproteobacteria-3]